MGGFLTLLVKHHGNRVWITREKGGSEHLPNKVFLARKRCLTLGTGMREEVG